MNANVNSFLGRYRLVKVLGQGAMGVVYEAEDARLGRTVAIKTVLRSHLVDEATAREYASRFEREAQAAARLTHPNVVSVFDFGEHQDISYIVMEFVRGRELAQAFERGERFTLRESMRIMGELLAALEHAHAQGIVHRDIKPANVMLDVAGHVKLTDFGVARVANANSDRTMPGTMVGTPSYMSPEQILGLAVGSRADLFAVGVILYQFLTGKRPFTGGGPFGVQRKIVQDDPEPPSVAAPGVPAAFDAIVAKALAKDPAARHESAAAFAAELRQLVAALPAEVVDAAPAAAASLPPAAPAEASTPRERGTGAAAAPARDATATAPLSPLIPPRADASAAAPVAAATAPATAPGTRQGAATAPPTPPGAVPARAPERPRAAPHAAAVQPSGARWLPLLAGASAGLLLVAAAWWWTSQPRGAAPAPPAVARQPAPVEPARADPAPPPGAGAHTAPRTSMPTADTSVGGTAAPDAAAATTGTTQARPPTEAAAPAPAPAHAREPGAQRAPRAAASPSPAAATTPVPARESAVPARCGDLLQRMQLGEPLSAEQNTFFQTRCTR